MNSGRKLAAEGRSARKGGGQGRVISYFVPLKLKLYLAPAFLFYPRLLLSLFFIRDVLPFPFKYPCHPSLPFHSSLPVNPFHAPMSPVALHQQHAAVLHAPKDLRIDDRTLWPPQQGQAQVAVVSTGLCGSDRMFPLRQPHALSHIPPLAQYTTIFTAATVISPSKHP